MKGREGVEGGGERKKKKKADRRRERAEIRPTVRLMSPGGDCLREERRHKTYVSTHTHTRVHTGKCTHPLPLPSSSNLPNMTEGEERVFWSRSGDRHGTNSVGVPSVTQTMSAVDGPRRVLRSHGGSGPFLRSSVLPR